MQREARIAELEISIENIERQLQDSEAKREAAEQSLRAKIGVAQEGTEGLPDVAWGLAWAEYWQRTGQFAQFNGPHSLRSKIDRNGNRWNIHSLPLIDGLSGASRDLFIDVAKELGYDPYDPPKKEAFMLQCLPDPGKYDVACVEIENALRQHLQLQRNLARAQNELPQAESRSPEAALAVKQQIKQIAHELKQAATKFNECKAVIDSAIQKFYLIWMQSFEEMDFYGTPIQCCTATVLPQKRYEHLPALTPFEPELSGIQS